jgi:hypothetical protein
VIDRRAILWWVACGAVRYECSAVPVAMVNCHCRDCQRTGGTGFSPTVVVPADSFRLHRGEPKRYSITADSGHTAHRAFCGECGAPLFASSSARKDFLGSSRQAALMTRVGSSRRLKCGLQAHSRGIIWVPTCHTLRTVGSALRMPNKRPAADAAPVAVPSDFESVRLAPCGQRRR